MVNNVKRKCYSEWGGEIGWGYQRKKTILCAPMRITVTDRMGDNINVPAVTKQFLRNQLGLETNVERTFYVHF